MRDNKQLDCIRVIEHENSLLKLTDSNGNTIFHWTAYYGRLQVMEAIDNIDAHMKDRTSEYNMTPLMWASSNDQVASVKWLLDHDADVNIKSVHGKTALNWACNQEIKDIIKEK